MTPSSFNIDPVQIARTAFNACLVAAFGWVSLSAWGEATAALDKFGGIRGLRSLVSTLGQADFLTAAETSIGLASHMPSLGWAWLCLIAAAGSGWMAFLGGRSVALTLLRITKNWP